MNAPQAPAWFVAGTDTEVGKTFVTCALLHAFAAQGLNAVGMKPIAAGTDADGCNEDVEQLLAAMPVKPVRELVNPYLFAPPIAPHIAAAEAGRAIEPGPIRTAFDALRAHEGDTVRVGCALHSLRAVPPQAMREVLHALPMDARIHVHIAEQMAEVEECITLRGARPVQWLLDNATVDARWTLVHATHLDDAELQGIARSGATVAICTTTEGNLGDGLFPLRAYLDAGGRWGVGSDSHISVSPVEELRWLEYGQRLVTRRRNIASSMRSPSVGTTLFAGVQASAADSTGFDARDRIVLDADAPVLAGASEGDLIDRWIFSGNASVVRDVEVAGVRVVEDGRHRDREAIAARYREAMKALLL